MDEDRGMERNEEWDTQAFTRIRRSASKPLHRTPETAAISTPGGGAAPLINADAAQWR